MSRLGPLRHREFRLLFAGRTISMAGSAMAPVALAFAVLDLTGSTTDLGLVLAARQIPVILLLLFGGVWADRLPRHHVMVASNVASGASQAVVAALLLTGRAQIWQLALLAAMNGASSAFFFPASNGVIPQTVTRPMLQQANAMLRLALNATNITGAAIGGILVALTSPGTAIAIDAVSYFAAAACIGAMRLTAAERTPGSTVLHELREGWHDFWSRTWLWVIVLQFGIVNAFESGAVQVLGPGIAKDDLGGPAAWGAILTATSLGLILCGFMMMRWRPRRILFTATLAVFPLALPLIALAIPAPLVVVIACAFAAGFFVEIFGVLWDTSMQQEIPPEKLSRLYSYDALGSWVLIPVAYVALGPISHAVGTRTTLLGCAVLTLAATAPVLLSRDVRTLERRTAAPEAVAEPATS
jgi:MFS family permease